MVVEVTKLNNGITVVSQSMPHLASTALGVWVAAGSRTELPSENGISHLLEHMAFKGTRTRSAAAIAEEIENVGGELNAATSIESTSYYARVLAGDMPLALDILADILQDSVFDPEELVREKHVITQEIGATLDTPEDLVFDFFQEAAFPGQPIGRPILGSVDTVNGFDHAALRHYLARQYVGPRTVIAAAGKMDHGELVRMARERFDSFAHAAAPDDVRATYLGGERREEQDLMEAQVVLGFRGASYHSPDFMTAQIAARCSAAACPPGCSRKSARSGASATRSTPSTGPSPTTACSASTRRPAATMPARWWRRRSTSCCAPPTRSPRSRWPVPAPSCAPAC
ncbi:Protease 3 precursor [Methylobrevis pamukkalensis]|uniref:Protease 3 n=1 Tax=Methylobrevis pamukkalensis TaxID=1439726 RepID=A0A1E3H5M7_9HYPH|nr:Protease 3 precursor [Methylobrevis pamukkalensis]